MNRFYAFVVTFLLLTQLYAQKVINVNDTALVVKLWVDSTSIVDDYKARMDSISVDFNRNHEEIDPANISDNPLYYRLFMPLTFYKSAVSEAITPFVEEVSDSDNDLLPIEDFTKDKDDELMQHINKTLMRIYMEHPELVQMTEDELMSVNGSLQVTDASVVGIGRSQYKQSRFQSPEAPEFISNKPVYWTTSGNFQGKYTQSYYSDNWYKGGEKNHSFHAQLILNAKYAKKHTTFENKLEMKLGYYTTEVNGEKKWKTNEDLLRFTTKYGLRAVNYWYYTAQIQGYTQFMPVFDKNDRLKSKFFAPAYGSVSIGMDYKPKFKNKKVTLSALLSPLTYSCRYVSVDSIATNFGIEKGENYKYTIGYKVDTNWTWKFMDDLKWTGKAQAYSDYGNVEANIENTIDYAFSRYFSLQFFFSWRFDDSVKPDDKYGYNQLKEFVTLNFNYSWGN